MRGFKQKRTAWSEEDMRELYTMAREGKPVEEMYAAFPNRTRRSVDYKLQRHGFSTAKRKSYERE